MSQLIQFRQRIRSIQATKKVTHAIRLVSMSMHAKLENKNVNLQQYTTRMKDFFSELLPFAKITQLPALFTKAKADTNPLIIIIASSRGFCGSFNSALFRHIEKETTLKNAPMPKFIVIGQKAIKFSKDLNIQPLSQYTDLNTNNFVKIADDLIEKIMRQELTFSSITFYSNIAKNFFIQRPQTTVVLPMQQQATSIDEDDEDCTPLLEQPLPDVLEFLSTNYLRASILELLFQSLKAEHAARFLAMDSSTTNAEKILDSLTMQYNKLRQALITREVAELSAGSSSQAS